MALTWCPCCLQGHPHSVNSVLHVQCHLGGGGGGGGEGGGGDIASVF
jgi:hypothetical protein